MSRITRISPQKKKGFFNIFVDGKFAFGLDEEALVRDKLHEGDELSLDEVERLKGDSDFGKVINRVLHFLSFRPRSRTEVERYIRALDLPRRQAGLKTLRTKDLESVNERVIKKLEEWGYINDEEFARWLVGQRTQAKNPKGPVALKLELLKKGIDRSLVDELVSSTQVKFDDERLGNILEKKDRGFRSLPALKRRKRLYDFLLRRGFTYGQVKGAVDHFIKKG